MTTQLQVPQVHLNGTSRDALLESYLEAGRAVADAIRAVQAAGPNGRDYYPLGPEAFGRALAQHADRLGRLQAVRSELEQLAESVGG